MRKDNKAFVKSMIVTAVIGFSMLMIMMFIGIKFYVDKSGTNSNLQMNNEIEKVQPKVDYSATVLALVQQIDDETLIAFDIHKNQIVRRSITSTTKVSDGYGGVIPLSSIQAGDIVEVVFQPDKEKILSINKTSRSWIKPDISGVIVNTSKSQINIGKKTYNFTKDMMVFREGGKGVSPSFVGEYDILQLQGAEDTVWSIKVLQNGATLEILDLPNTDGMLEIDRTRMIPLKDLTGPIGLTPGKHRLQINIKGYEPVVEEMNFVAGEHHQISLKDAKEAYTELNLKVTNRDADYTIQIGDRIFKKGDKISLKYDKYNIIVKAEGYKNWEQEIDLDTAVYDLAVTLQKIEEVNPNTGNSGDSNLNPSNGNYTINISSNPSGAFVYIGGVYKGQTPFRTTLPIGDYAVSLEKSGYQSYFTTIILDGSDNQNNYFYELTPQQ